MAHIKRNEMAVGLKLQKRSDSTAAEVTQFYPGTSPVLRFMETYHDKWQLSTGSSRLTLAEINRYYKRAE